MTPASRGPRLHTLVLSKGAKCGFFQPSSLGRVARLLGYRCAGRFFAVFAARNQIARLIGFARFPAESRAVTTTVTLSCLARLTAFSARLLRETNTFSDLPRRIANDARPSVTAFAFGCPCTIAKTRAWPCKTTVPVHVPIALLEQVTPIGARLSSSVTGAAETPIPPKV